MKPGHDEVAATKALLRYFISICNVALERWREEHPADASFDALLQPIEGKTLLLEALDDSGAAIAGCKASVSRGKFTLARDDAAAPDLRCRVARSKLEDVWTNAVLYIAQPAWLDWGWLRGEAGIGG